MSSPAPFETFPALCFPFCAHAFTRRVPGLDVRVDREQALERLESYQSQVRIQLGFEQYAAGEQVHGNAIAVLADSSPITPSPIAGVDGLITNRPGLCLGVQVADCGPVYLLDPVRRAVGLLHSGRKGTELGIVPAAIALMATAFGSIPSDLVVQLGPCIRPPLYETDFASEILRQARDAGVNNVFDCGSNTGADLSLYYSYRMEKGRTGRMLALLGIRSISSLD